MNALALFRTAREIESPLRFIGFVAVSVVGLMSLDLLRLPSPMTICLPAAIAVAFYSFSMRARAQAPRPMSPRQAKIFACYLAATAFYLSLELIPATARAL